MEQCLAGIDPGIDCYIETNPWELAETLHKKFTNKIEASQHLIDTLEAKLKLSQTSRSIQKEEIKELKEELIELEKELLLLPR
jgi:hypothetical protein